MNNEGIVRVPFAFHKFAIFLKSFEFSDNSTWLTGFLLSEVVICRHTRKSKKADRLEHLHHRDRELRRHPSLSRSSSALFLLSTLSIYL
ncbi:hypothetical protein PUN28_002092 [Cardiocondyla obscurior]|uniref:Uncharacterized protein n=1 Tax=Cardiocondyla obscurior TaxID=286306 RepID=A0AAW2GSP4_9HYME